MCACTVAGKAHLVRHLEVGADLGHDDELFLEFVGRVELPEILFLDGMAEEGQFGQGSGQRIAVLGRARRVAGTGLFVLRELHIALVREVVRVLGERRRTLEL